MLTMVRLLLLVGLATVFVLSVGGKWRILRTLPLLTSCFPVLLLSRVLTYHQFILVACGSLLPALVTPLFALGKSAVPAALHSLDLYIGECSLAAARDVYLAD